jgi:hypothetical protein
VEFGAWDGQHLSNSRNLIVNDGYEAVLIEADGDKFQTLRALYSDDERVTTLHGFVGFGEHDNLDVMLSATPIPNEFDLLIIDIDGNDYHAWKAATAYRPSLVCVEFNPTIPNEVDFIQPADPRRQWGASLRSLVSLGRDKGYELICVLPWNALFVRAEYFAAYSIADNAPETLRADLSSVTYIFSGVDGTVFLRGARSLPWQTMQLNELDFQQLPKALRKWPPVGSLRVRATVSRFYKFFNGVRSMFRRYVRNR